MKGRRSPIDKMRELADDGLEPWQIAAALGVREDAVLVALKAAEPAGGAQRAVEDALSLVPVTSSDAVRNHAIEEVTALAREMADTFTEIDAVVDAITPEQIDARLADVISSAETWGVDATQAPMSEPGDATTGPSKPDTLAPTRPMTQRLAEHVAGYADGMAVRACEVCAKPIDDDGGPDEPWCHRCRTVMGAIAEGAPAALAVEAYASTRLDRDPDYGTHSLDEASEPEQIHKPAWQPGDPGATCGVCGQTTDDYAWHSRLSVAVCSGCPLDDVCGENITSHCMLHVRSAAPEPEHVHDPFPVADETGVWHAECECGHRWDRALCEYSGCTAYVAALHIARTGTSRHAHHPPA